MTLENKKRNPRHQNNPLPITTEMTNEEIRKTIIPRFLKRRDVKEICGEDFVITEKAILELIKYFKINSYIQQWEAKLRTLAYLVKGDQDNYEQRMVNSRILSHNSLEWAINCMGEEQAKIWHKIQKDKRKKGIFEAAKQNGVSSKSAKELFDDISEAFKDTDYDFIYDNGSHKEWRMKEYELEKVYAYDFKVRDYNLVIEYNGEHVHPRKDKLTKEEWNNWTNAWSKKSADECYVFDQAKNNFLLNQGFKVLVLWYEDGQNSNFNKACEWLKENLNLDNLSTPKKPVKCRKYLITYPDGNTIIINNLKVFGSRLDNPLTDHHAKRILNNGGDFKGWKIQRIDERM